ncbi:condensation domain-containing protein [Planobispora takensis]|uniref:condensation domain-containing protein n=1 Tax=Planobispora takensis TaxID=1367882 RepID=UPI001942098A|nr:condensation domain-containing protein [Planobispora takensis]
MSLVEEWERASLAQHGMWITERTGAGGPVYRMPLAVHLDGPLDVEAMLAACAAVVRRHPILASALAERDGQVWSVPAEVAPPILFEDVSGDGLGPEAGGTIAGAFAEVTAGVTAELAAGVPGSPEWVAARAAEPLDVRTGPVSRFTLFRLGPDRHLLLVVAHHAVFDGMSKDVLLRDLAAAYGGAGLDPLAVPYGEAARAEQDRVEADLAAAAEFWRSRWHDDRDVLLPGAGRSSLRAAPGDAVDLALGGEVAEAAGRLGVTRFELVLAALQVLLHAYGNEPVTVAVDLSTRTEETRDHVGPFVNELPVTCAPYGTFAEFAEAVRRELRAVYRYRHVPLARALGGIGPRTALTPVSVSYRARSGADPLFPGLDARVEWAMFNGTVRNTLHLQAVDGPAGLSARLQFNPAVIDRAGCEAVAGHLRALLAAVAARPDAPIGELPLPLSESRPAQTPVSGTETAPAGQPVTGTGTDAALVGQVAAIWRDVLGLEEVLPDDDLFDLGGHSLTITQIIAQVRDRMGVELSFEVFIDDPTVTGVADEIARSR